MSAFDLFERSCYSPSLRRTERKNRSTAETFPRPRRKARASSGAVCFRSDLRLHASRLTVYCVDFPPVIYFELPPSRLVAVHCSLLSPSPSLLRSVCPVKVTRVTIYVQSYSFAGGRERGANIYIPNKVTPHVFPHAKLVVLIALRRILKDAQTDRLPKKANKNEQKKKQQPFFLFSFHPH